MEKDQLKLLSSLAKKIQTEEKTREEIVSTLRSANILTKDENLTIHYSNLKRVVITSK